MKKIIFTGGGTAGHITPNIAIINKLNDFEIHYIGQKDSMESQMISSLCPQVNFHFINCVKFRRKLCLENFAIPYKFIKSSNEAKILIDKIDQSIIFSKGGYVSLGVMSSANSKKIALLLHESDNSMGLANKLVAKKCRYVCTSFSSLADRYKNGICTGAPLRADIYSGNSRNALSECKLYKKKKNLLIMGGSLGAKAINDAVYKILDSLCISYNVVHITGKNNKQFIFLDGYYQIPFTNHIEDYFDWADMAVTRGGANALFELVALKIPSLVIPLPKTVSRGDQIDNANYFLKKGCVEVLEQSLLENDHLALKNAILSLEKNSKNLSHNCFHCKNIDGTNAIVDLIKSL